MITAEITCNFPVTLKFIGSRSLFVMLAGGGSNYDLFSKSAVVKMPDLPMESILLAGVLFGSIGCGAFVYGKRRASAAHMILGVLLISYPYFTSNTLALYGVGIALTLALFMFKS